MQVCGLFLGGLQEIGHSYRSFVVRSQAGPLCSSHYRVHYTAPSEGETGSDGVKIYIVLERRFARHQFSPQLATHLLLWQTELDHEIDPTKERIVQILRPTVLSEEPALIQSC